MGLQTRTPVLTLLAALVAASMAGCVNAEAQGMTSIFVKDAPADGLSHLNVTFSMVQVHQMANKTAERDEREQERSDDRPTMTNVTGGTPSGTGRLSVAVDVSEENDSEHDDGQWITIEQGNMTIDLKAFSGNASAFLGDANVPVGSYNQIRLTVVAATATFTDGTTQDVKVPGHALRIQGRFTVAQDKDTKITLDFDLGRSLVRTDDGKLILKPVIRMESERRERPDGDERHERDAMREQAMERERERRERRNRD